MTTSSINILIQRINELSRKQRSEGLEEWEKAEQEVLRQEYLSFIRGQVKETLSKVKFVDDPPIQ
ncbi:hypothetical protein Desaci_2919 [Desulfosporosinus acidiphilus SJ4]|uniref:UPF0291 protein Desaci_2919 n=1 Tax=Desulfosporosinus acidiphilus (strain DSM 22704 / JCM 16185 / SJ4) TaxID=646529 RepID=I4D7Q6_DESAJ|nr:DUF896 domain-containing protein [Desulfosporosinus acidiphilus]AFM41830.1 hypothetical protein Desaci_2919 [Desulfosporosinus acidiphilus SJ4]